jgi:hypothetical protein
VAEVETHPQFGRTRDEVTEFGIVRLIRKWLKAGVLEDGNVMSARA